MLSGRWTSAQVLISLLLWGAFKREACKAKWVGVLVLNVWRMVLAKEVYNSDWAKRTQFLLLTVNHNIWNHWTKYINLSHTSPKHEGRHTDISYATHTERRVSSEVLKELCRLTWQILLTLIWSWWRILIYSISIMFVQRVYVCVCVALHSFLTRTVTYNFLFCMCVLKHFCLKNVYSYHFNFIVLSVG